MTTGDLDQISLGEGVEIRCVKLDGSLSWSWRSTVKARDEYGLWLYTPLGTAHTKPGAAYLSGRDSIVLIPVVGMWMARFYAGGDAGDPSVYLDVALPPVLSRLEGRAFIDVVDLDLDVLLVDGQTRLDDEDEFAANALRMSYPERLQEAARAVARGLAAQLSSRQRPFDTPADLVVTRLR